jgi:myosin heavy subunit
MSRMRTVGLLVLLCLVLGTTGCKSKGDAEAAAPDPAAVKAQQELVARRDALLAQKQKLQSEATSLEVQIKEGKAAGKDTTALEKQQADVKKQMEEQDSNLNNTSSELSALSSKLDAAGGVAAREAAVAKREAEVAIREKEAFQKMKDVLAAEGASADRWKEGCNTGGSPMIIQQVAPPKSGNYSRKEVDALVGRAKASMAKKGLTSADLGAQANLEGEVTKALSESDWTRGYILASQLVQTIDAIQVNRGFIGAKVQRLQNRVKSANVDEATQAQLTEGLKDVLQKYGDQDFAAANRKINQLWSLLK